MYQKALLSNKLRVITHAVKDRESVSIGIWVGTGGRYENDQNKGAAHFLEHILFKGSEHYSCKQIKELVEGVGGSLNAFTTEETTCVFAKIPLRHWTRTFDILTDMVFCPLIQKKDVDKERTVILEEIKMYHDLPQYYVLELLDELMWPNHPLGKSLAGTFESVSQMSPVDLRGFHHTHYFPGNVVISACGHLEHKDFVNVVQKKLGPLGSAKTKDFLKAENNPSKPKAKFFRKETEQMHLALGVLGLPYDHPDKYAFNLLNVILGANMSSRLFDELREKRGLAYSISSSTKSLRDTGIFLIRAGVDNRKIVEAVSAILEQLKIIRQKGTNKDEFHRAKDYFLGQFLLGLEDTLDHMLWIGEATITLKKAYTLPEIIRQVNKVKMDDIGRLADNLFKENRFNLALIGPLKDNQEKEMNSLLSVGT